MSGFTPGPLKIVKAKAVVGGGWHVFIAAEDRNIAACWGSEAEKIGNAQLWHAAPDLYEALQLLHDNLAEYQRINNLGGYDNHDMKMARAALAKATTQNSKKGE